VTTWEARCYSDGIPDEIPEGLSKSLRAPSYKAIAMAILRNDLALTSLGFSGEHSQWYDVLKDEKKKADSPQMKLI
jgi:predicted phosphoadenosine phosphosulfate sulfurtransferase